MTVRNTFYRTFQSLPNFRLKGYVGRWYKQRLKSRNYFQVRHDLLMDLDPWEWLQNQIRRDGGTEPLTTKLFESILGPKDSYIDVGAHVGYFTLIARYLVGESGVVIAVEPQPYNCAKILTNWEINSFENIVLYPAVIDVEEGALILHDQPASDRARLSIRSPSLPGDRPQRFRVPKLRLDTVMREMRLNSIKLLKLDTEGVELEVVNSLGDAISQIENIVVEVWDPSRDEYKRLSDYLLGHGFVLKTVTGDLWDGVAPLPESNLFAAKS